MRIAITGGPADGKSTILSALSEQGYVCASADDVVRELQTSADYLRTVEAIFGPEATGAGSLNRKYLRGRILTDPSARRELNRITHRAALDALLDRLPEAPSPSFAEVPLLIETACQGAFDEVWVCDAGDEERRRRLLERHGGDARAVDLALRVQLPTEVKAAFADRILRTNQPMPAVKLLAIQLASSLARKLR